MSETQSPINETYALNIADAIGSLADQYQITYLDYSIYHQGVLSIYSSDSQDICRFLNDPQSTSPIIMAQNSETLPWESYCSEAFLEHLNNTRGLNPTGICIIVKDENTIERLSIGTDNMDLNLYETIQPNPQLQEQLLSFVQQYSQTHQSQPLEITLNLPSFPAIESMSETMFKKIEQENLMKAHPARNTCSQTLPNEIILETQSIETLWDIKALETISNDLQISIETVHTYIQLLRRKEANLYKGEIDCLYLAASGHTAKETAATLKISVHTAREYRQSAIKKLDANNITHAIYLALKKNIIS